MTSYTLIAIILMALATTLAALSISLLKTRRSALQRHYEARGQADVGEWLVQRRQTLRFSVSLLRTAARIGFFIMVLVDILGMGEVNLTWPTLVLSGLLATVLLWLFSSVLATAIAQHAGLGLVTLAVPLLRALDLVAMPLLKPLSIIDEAVRRLAGAPPHQDEAEAELLRSIEDTQREGALDSGAAAILENVVDFTDSDTAEIMTPRTDVQGLELTDDLPVIKAFIADAGHSRIPVFRENLDNIVGILYVKDLVPYLGEDASDFKLEPILRTPIMVPETKPIPELLTEFQRRGVHLAIVVDEYGGTGGIVTIEDVLEEIVGEIHDEYDPLESDEPTCVEVEPNRVEVDGRFHIDDLNEQLGLHLPEDEDYDTIAGFVLAQLGRIPSVGENFESTEAKFTAVAVTSTRVRKIAIELYNGSRTQGGNGGHANGK